MSLSAQPKIETLASVTGWRAEAFSDNPAEAAKIAHGDTEVAALRALAELLLGELLSALADADELGPW